MPCIREDVDKTERQDRFRWYQNGNPAQLSEFTGSPFKPEKSPLMPV